MELTEMQRAAVGHRGGALLISAGAGSGKTRVLIERLMSLVEEGADVDRFLVITYTRAAAAELKERLSRAIAERLAQDPGNRQMRRQAALVYRMRIDTIHAFCADLIREFAPVLDVKPDFRQLEPAEAEALLEQSLEELLERRYEEMTPEFAALADMLGAGRDDAALCRIVLETRGAVQSHPDPEGWMAEQSALLREEEDAGATPWGKYLLQRAERQVLYWRGRMEALVPALREDEDTSKKYLPSWLDTLNDLDRLLAAVRAGWDETWRFGSVAFPGFSAVKGRKDDPFLAAVKRTRDDCKKAMEKLLAGFEAPGAELLGDMARMRPVIEALYALVTELGEEYAANKRRRGVLDFNDLEHLALRLLTEPEGGPARAAEVAGRFQEILVDEYQDVNRLQEAIFGAVSREGRNVTMVGDVKQSIYRFRLADPDIFLEKYDQYADWPAPAGEPSRILLSHNFRSRPEILDTVNFVFSRLMSPELGELRYGEREAMLPGRTDPGAFDEAVEFDFCQTPEEEDKLAYEAACVAGRVKELLRSGATVEGEPLRPGDVAILLRSPKGAGEAFRAALEAQGLPAAVVGGAEGLFDCFENGYLLSLLRVIDNPMQDIPLIAALRGPVWGFSADELAMIRAAAPKEDLYTALRARAETDEHCADFLRELERWREKAMGLPADVLIRELLAATGLPALAEARQSGASERLYAVQSYARDCEDADCRGLYGFLQRVDSARQPTLRRESGGGVRIMSVHASKGLEFPVVILADLGRAVNLSDSKRPLLIHRELGAGPRLTDRERGIVYPTLSRVAIAAKLNNEAMSEDLRVLYVAMTRAREKLICVFSAPEPEEKLEKLRLGLTDPPAPELLEKRACFADWLLSALLCDPAFSYSLLTPPDAPEEGESPAAGETTADPALTEALRRSLRWEPPMASRGLPSKVTATALKSGFRAAEAAEEAEELAPVADFRRETLPRPRFITGETGLTPAERGTALHMAMQLLDFAHVGSEEEIAGELRRLRELRLLTPEQAEAAEPARLLRFFRSELGRRALAAESLRREFKFSVLIPARELYGRGEGEVLLQGVVDLFFEEEDGLVLVDFKSDRIRKAEREQRAAEYAGQLSAYAEALRRITGRPVKEKHLFFFACD